MKRPLYTYTFSLEGKEFDVTAPSAQEAWDRADGAIKDHGRLVLVDEQEHNPDD